MSKSKKKKAREQNSLAFLNKDYDFSKHLIEYMFTDKSSFKFTKNLIEKIYNQAKQNDKIPFIIVSIPYNETHNFVLHCNIDTKRKA